MRKVKIYEVKSGSTGNALKLLSDDSKYFYWNNAKFLGNEIGDIVFIVNRNANWVCLTEISQKDITTQQNREMKTSSFSFRNKSYSVSDTDGVYNIFIEFEVKEKREMPTDWNWTKQLGQSETFDLVKDGLQGQTERISKIDDLAKIFDSGEGCDILKEASEFLTSGKSITKPQKQSNKPNDIFESDMNILTAIKTKPFILLAGISGTGKSRLVRTLAYKTCHKEDLRSDPKKPGNFELIPVRPNWHDSSELIGYVSRINGEKYIVTSFLKFIAKAWRNMDVPFFLCLDEMNLAPVEQYFAEFLSIIETRQVKEDEIVTDFIISKSSFENYKIYQDLLIELELDNESNFNEGIGIPKNLVVIGTVNMDETTHSFSKKVLDRAMTFEMNRVDLNLGLDISKKDWEYPKTDNDYYKFNDVIGKFTSGAEVYELYKESKKVISYLIKINEILEGSPFKIAYRVRDEFLIYCYYASLIQNKNWLDIAIDEMTSMKILSRIEGDEMKTSNIIEKLLLELKSNFPISTKKLNEMKDKLQFGYTSFWS